MIFKELQAKNDLYLYREVYLHRIAEYRVEPPGENWDGVYIWKTK